jgi:Domain of unknown function (DUF4347)
MTPNQREIAVIDCHVDDPAVLLAALRPDVEPVLLSDDAPALWQSAEAVKHRTNLAAIHVIAHGAPGQVKWGTKALALETLQEDGADLAAIGRAFGRDGCLLLWSCHTAAGERGKAFVDALARATGTQVAASTGLVGAATLGGQWELHLRSGASKTQAPLTADGIANYASVMALPTSESEIDTQFSGPSVTAVYPPHNALAVDPNYIVMVEGSQIEWTDLTGGSPTQQSVSSFFSPLSPVRLLGSPQRRMQRAAHLDEKGCAHRTAMEDRRS